MSGTLATAALACGVRRAAPAAIASRSFRVAVIGSTGRGNYGHDLDRAWLEFPECRVVAVADDHPAGLAAAVKRLGVRQGFADYRKLLDEIESDVVAICPRWIDRHRDMAVAAAERGRHIILEKPFCRTPAEADEIITACRNTGAKLAIGHPTPYSPKFATLQRLIREGAVGRVLEYRGRGKEDRRGGAEDLWVLGSHVLDMIRHLGGRPEWCFARVTHEGRPVTKADVRDGAEGLGPLAGDGLSALYGMADGSTAHFASSRDMAGRPSRYGLT
ncbi:MAG TPA: Gfo/Idh/MocA family oxidoreductase, partial [Planctomycetaceae bacterium]|nr:Gfo/Idh/MocA family oxidoreductase [Planctomycetaceae bacterium]